MKKGIRSRMVVSVLLTVSAAFLICGISSSFYFLHIFTEQVLHDESQKLCQAARQIQSIQDNAEYTSRAIAIDHTIQNIISRYSREDTVGQLFYQSDVRTRLTEYLNDKPYFYSVRILTQDAVFVSHSTMAPSAIAEEWYTRFKESGQNAGFTAVHQSYDPASKTEVQTISYIQSFYDMKTGKTWRGDIVIDINMEYLLKNANLDPSILSGYVLYTNEGNLIFSQGEFPAWQDVNHSSETHTVKQLGGNYLLSDRCMQGGWVFVSKISNQLLMNRLANIPLFFGIVFLAVLLPLSAILYHYIKRILKPVDRLTQAAEEVGRSNFAFTVKIDSHDEFQSLGEAFNRMTAAIDRYIHQSIQYEQAVKKMEIDRLMLQINPHFIYNTLDSIVYMAKIEGNGDIAEFASALIALLQNTLKVDGENPFLSLKTELQNLQHYLILQKYRYPDKFDVTICVENDCMDCKVPTVLLQPLVENAIFHGLCSRPGKGKLSILGYHDKEHNGLVLCVQDDGMGMSKEQMEHLFEEHEKSSNGMRKIGMYNVKKRMEELYGPPYGVTAESSQGKGTKITLFLPFQKLNP